MGFITEAMKPESVIFLEPLSVCVFYYTWLDAKYLNVFTHVLCSHVQAYAHLSVVMWLMKHISVSHSVREAVFNYLN